MGKDKNDPSFNEQVKIQRDADVAGKELVEPLDYSQILQRQALVEYAVLETRFEKYFTRVLRDGHGGLVLNPDYIMAVEPLEPLCSQILQLGKLTPEQLRRWRGRLHSIVQQCYALTNDRREQLIIQSMEQHLNTAMEGRTNDGFLLRCLTTNEKVLRLTTPQGEKQKPWYQFW